MSNPTPQPPVKPKSLRQQYTEAFKLAGRSKNRDKQVAILRKYAMMYAKKKYGWNRQQFELVNKIWTQESQWDWRSENPSSGAYGIAQKMGGTRIMNPFRQIEVGLKYINHRYETPEAAYKFKKQKGWY